MAANDYKEVERLVRTNKLDEAMTKANALLKGRPNDPQIRFIKGVIQLGEGKRAEAVTTFTQLTQDAPELPEPYNNLAAIYASQNQFDKAFSALESAIRTNPSYATASENLGDLYALQRSQANNKSQQLDQSDQPKLALIPTLFMPPGTKTKPMTRGTAAPAPVAKALPAESEPAFAPAKATPSPASVAASAGAPEAAPQAASTAEVESAVRAWASAWASKDMDRYLAAYGTDFVPSGGQSRKSWEQDRRARIVGKSSIYVDLENLVIKVDGDNATAKFRQIYRADDLNVSNQKTLGLHRYGNQWHIRKESVSG